MADGKGLVQGFKEFIMRGNVVDLAVAVVIGAAFTAIITAVVNGLINPLIAAVFGKNDLTHVGEFTINNATFSIGLVLNALIYFLIVALVIYFLVIVPMNHLAERRARGQEPEPEAVPEDIALLREIRDALQARGGPTS